MIEFISVAFRRLALLGVVQAVAIRRAPCARPNIVKAWHIVVCRRACPRLRELARSCTEQSLCDLQELFFLRRIGERDLPVLALCTVFECCFFECGFSLEEQSKRRFLLVFCLLLCHIGGVVLDVALGALCIWHWFRRRIFFFCLLCIVPKQTFLPACLGVCLCLLKHIHEGRELCLKEIAIRRVLHPVKRLCDMREVVPDSLSAALVLVQEGENLTHLCAVLVL